MNVKRRVVAAVNLALVSGSRKRLHPPHLPLGLLSILRKRHLPQLHCPRLTGKPSQTLLLVMQLKPELGARVTQQGNVPWFSLSGAGDGTRCAYQAQEVSAVADIQEHTTV
jgi:hypothetical protein